MTEPTTQAPLEEITLDLRTLTLGELAAVEMASGRSVAELWRSPIARRIMAVYIVGLRFSSSEPPPSWSEISDRRIIDG